MAEEQIMKLECEQLEMPMKPRVLKSKQNAVSGLPEVHPSSFS